MPFFPKNVWLCRGNVVSLPQGNLLDVVYMRSIIFYTALFYMVFSAKVFAGENMRSITVHNGLAGESVYKFYKSKWGVMWIGTSNGLSSYDGYHVQTYRAAEQRSKNLINDISQSNDGLIWVATKDGIWKLDRQKPVLIRQLSEIKGNVSCIKIIGEKIY